MARRRKGRAIDGILVLDKPMGVSSNRALQSVKHLYNAAKAGHTGSLDPLATGVLPLCLGEATKFSQYLLDADKAYESTFVLGVATATGDAEGEVLATVDASAVTEADVAAPEQYCNYQDQNRSWGKAGKNPNPQRTCPAHTGYAGLCHHRMQPSRKTCFATSQAELFPA